MVSDEYLKSHLKNGLGFSPIEVDSVQSLLEFNDRLLDRTNASSMVELRQQLVHLSNRDLNSVMMSLLAFTDASELLAQTFTSTITTLSGKEIFLQRRANIIMNLPGAMQRHQWPHYEFMSGISPFTYTVWVPLHDLEDEGGLYYLSGSDSYDMMRQEYLAGNVNSPMMYEAIGDQIPVKLAFGQALVFNPFVIHGNTEFQSDLARVAVSFRFQSRSAPLFQKDTDFFKSFTL